ncbi:hypothetical protein D3C71_497250 [compost metagenome]
MSREDLVVVVRRQIAFRSVKRDSLLDTHHDGVGEAAQQHDDRQDDVHDTDLLVIDTGDPVVPQRTPPLHVGDERAEGDAAQRDSSEGRYQDWLVVGDGFESQPAEDKLQEVRIGKHGTTRSLKSCDARRQVSLFLAPRRRRPWPYPCPAWNGCRATCPQRACSWWTESPRRARLRNALRHDREG